ncbi:hypothetical protein ACUN3E_37665 [Streptomyces sp. Ju416(a)]|uniref:hypothetical protein n=1 Tax=Streptomyces sp. Ju416(a) TaxID=3446591 RepID=UPI00403D89D0
MPAPQKTNKRGWTTAAVLTVLAGALIIVWANPREEQHPESYAKLANYKGQARAAIEVDGEHTTVLANWNNREGVVAISLSSGMSDFNDRGARYSAISAGGLTDSTVRHRTELAPGQLLVKIPFQDRFEDVTARVEIGGDNWKPGGETESREIRFSPYGTAYDAKTGKSLPSKLTGEVIVP